MRIILADGVSPVVLAWLQALYSRREVSVLEHFEYLGVDIEKLDSDNNLYIANAGSMGDTTKAEAFLNKWGIGYGHESIMDCGTITLFIEDIPIVLAKVLQHHPLYNGIELSTRYIEFGKEKAYDGLAVDEIGEYLEVLDVKNDEADFMYSGYPEKARRAWAFDHARGLLPVSAMTNLSLNVSIRALREILANAYLCTELPTYLFDPIYNILELKYPTISWRMGSEPNIISSRFANPTQVVNESKRLVSVGMNGVHELTGTIDFGSWRDIARQRTIHNLPFVYPAEGTEAHEFYPALPNGDEIGPAPKEWSNRRLAHLVPFSGIVHKEHYDYILSLRSTEAVHHTLRDFIGIQGALDAPPYAPRAKHDIIDNDK